MGSSFRPLQAARFQGWRCLGSRGSLRSLKDLPHREPDLGQAGYNGFGY